MLLLKAKSLLRLGRHSEAIEALQPFPANSPLAAEALKQKCIGTWLQNPRQDATALLTAFPVSDSPVAVACKPINSLISGNAEPRTANVELSSERVLQNHNSPEASQSICGGEAFVKSLEAAKNEHGAGLDRSGAYMVVREHRTASSGHCPGEVLQRSPEQPEAVRQEALAIALEALCLGDKDLALAIGRAVSGSPRPGDAWFILGKEALCKGYNQEARKLLERALGECAAQAEAFYLLGTACANLKLYREAFHYFWKAAQQSPGDELYAVCALEQLVNRCLEIVISGLNLEESNADLQRELFRLTSLKKRIQRYKGLTLNIER